MERKRFPEKCEFCGGQLQIHIRDYSWPSPSGIIYDFEHRAFCAKCYAYRMQSFGNPSSIEKKEQIDNLDWPTVCFLCHKPINEHERDTVYQDATERADKHDRYEMFFYAHEKCGETVGEPFLREMIRRCEKNALVKHGNKDLWTDADGEKSNEEELKFIKVVHALNQGEAVRKIAERLNINRNKVWRAAKNIARLKNGQSP